MNIRVLYNYILVRLGVRHILPAHFVNSKSVSECGEELVERDGCLVRVGVYERLKKANDFLPNGYRIVVVEGSRDESKQEQLRQEAEKKIKEAFPEITESELMTRLNKSVANRSGHLTGGAVDVLLYKNNEVVSCGSKYLEFNNETPSFARLNDKSICANRRILHKAMKKAGFVNYPAEWWHFSYGDKMWAAYANKHAAFYGDVNNLQSGV